RGRARRPTGGRARRHPAWVRPPLVPRSEQHDWRVAAVAVRVILGRAQPPADGLGTPVQRRALHEPATERFDDRAQLGLVELLAVARTGGAGDVLVHQGPTEVVGARPEDLP